MSISAGTHTLTIYTSRPNGKYRSAAGPMIPWQMIVSYYDPLTPPLAEGF